MAETQIAIVLHNGSAQEGLRLYVPGGDLRGVVRITPASQSRCEHLYVRLRWYTDGYGEQDGAKIGEHDLFQGPLPAHLTSSHEFQFSLPLSPWSYSGRLFSINWDVEVRLVASPSSGLDQRQAFIMAPIARLKNVPYQSSGIETQMETVEAPPKRPQTRRLILGALAGSTVGALFSLFIWPQSFAFLVGVPIGIAVAGLQSSKWGAKLGGAIGAVAYLAIAVLRSGELEQEFDLGALICGPLFWALIGAVLGAVAARAFRAILEAKASFSGPP